MTLRVGLLGASGIAPVAVIGPARDIGAVEVTAIVTAINQATREVTLKKDDGTEVTFVASEDVKNLPQVKVGDVLHVVYAEALAYEVRKGGTTAAPATAIAGGAAELGQRPAGAMARQTTATVAITAIDRAVPSIVFIAASISRAFKSGIFISAIFLTWAFVTLPAVTDNGVFDPFFRLASFSSKNAAGGVFLMKVKERSS